MWVLSPECTSHGACQQSALKTGFSHFLFPHPSLLIQESSAALCSWQAFSCLGHSCQLSGFPPLKAPGIFCLSTQTGVSCPPWCPKWKDRPRRWKRGRPCARPRRSGQAGRSWLRGWRRDAGRLLSVRVLLAPDPGGFGVHQRAQGCMHSPAWSLHLLDVTCQGLWLGLGWHSSNPREPENR